MISISISNWETLDNWTNKHLKEDLSSVLNWNPEQLAAATSKKQQAKSKYQKILSIIISNNQTISEQLETQPRDNELSTEQESESYSPLQFRLDVLGIPDSKSKRRYVTPKTNKESARAQWNRVTKDHEQLRIILDYGNFDISTTQRYHNSIFRVKTFIRSGQPMLSVGGINIHLTTGKVECMIGNCKHKGSLSYKPFQNSTPAEDREWMEFQVLRILYHLGKHNQHLRHHINPIAAPKVKRDTDEMRLQSRSKTLQQQTERSERGRVAGSARLALADSE